MIHQLLYVVWKVNILKGGEILRTVVRRNCTYKQYADMIDYIDMAVPFGIYETRYNQRLKLAIIGFWDSDYIPKEWEQWVVRPVSVQNQGSDAGEIYVKGEKKSL